MNRIPSDAVVESIDFTPDKFVLGGYGNEAEGWLREMGAASVKVTDLPKKDKFRAEFTF